MKLAVKYITQAAIVALTGFYFFNLDACNQALMQAMHQGVTLGF